MYYDLLDLFNSFHIRRKFFSHLSHLFVATLSRPSSSSVTSEFSSFDETSISVVIFYFADTDRGSTHSSQPHDAYYLLQNIKMENSNSNGGQMKPSIKSADMKEVRHKKTTTNKSSSRARVSSSLQNFRKSNQQTLLRRKTNRLF